MVGTEMDANHGILLQDCDLLTLLRPVQEDSVVKESKIHRQYIRVSLQIGHSKVTPQTFPDDRPDLTRISQDLAPHLLEQRQDQIFEKVLDDGQDNAEQHCPPESPDLEAPYQGAGQHDDKGIDHKNE